MVPAPQSEVWALLSDVTKATRWNRTWTRIELLSNQSHGQGTTFRAHTENGDSYDFEISEWSAPERLAFRPIRSPEEPRYAVTLESHEFVIGDGAEPDTARVELRAHATTSGVRGFLIGMFLWPGHQREGLNAALESVRDAIAGGTEPIDGSEPLSS
jgi:hypothetical protein